MDIQTVMVAVDGDRELCVDVAGEEDGPLILVHSGTPNSRIMAPDWVSDAVGRGARVACYDRPGYGRSTPQPGRTIADCAADVRAVAGALGAERLAVWGISGGGPHALACAALLPDIVRAVASLASPAPYGSPGLDFFAGMGELNVEDFKQMVEDREAARVKSRRDREELLELSDSQLLEAWSTLLSPPDVAWLTEERVAFLLASIKEGLAPGDEGWWEDGVADLDGWGFEFDAIAVPVQVWHGAQDRMVPFQHGEWVAAHVPGVEAHLTDTDGHLTLLDRVPEVHEWLLAHD
jgi:pimeloyl-ACP methyl ester carboxylesterase